MSQNRYSRQELFNGIGAEGQKSLATKHVVIIGAGALGCANAEMLVRAGVGRVTMIDRDYVDWSNLQRQQLFTEEDAKNRHPKAVAAMERLQTVNTDVEVEGIVAEVTPAVLEEYTSVDLLLDGLDNFETRMMINDFSQKHNIPWVYGACVGSYGITYPVIPGKTPCLHCFMDDIPLGGETCDTAGIIAPAVQMVAAYQTTEALKLLTNNEENVRRTLNSFDLWTNEQARIHVEKLKRTDCPSCGKQREYPFLQYENQNKVAVLCGRDAVQIRPPAVGHFDLNTVTNRLGQDVMTKNRFLVEFKAEGKRFVLFHDGRAIIHGVSETGQAKTLYHKYIGG